MSARVTPLKDIGPAEIFNSWSQPETERWQEWKAAGGKGRAQGFSPKAQKIYRCIWERWCKWLAPRKDGALYAWAHASEEDVKAFLDGAALHQATRKPIGDALANYSRQRYWRILRDVYTHALARKMVAGEHPVHAVATPTVERRSRVPRQLPVGMLGPLRDARRLRELIPERDDCGWLVARDRAAVALLAATGITAAELEHLKGRDVRLPRTPRQQRQIPDTPVECAHLDVDGRSLEIPPAARELLEDWLDERKEVLASRRDRAIAAARRAGKEPAPKPLAPPREQPLFIGLESADGAPKGLKPVTLHRVVQNCLRPLYEDLRRSGQLTTYAAAGPAAIRNSVIAEWVRTGTYADAARRAGVQTLSDRFREQEGERHEPAHAAAA